MVRYDVFDRLLKEKGYKVIDVAEATGIPQSTFTDWKKGRVKSMKAEAMLAIAEFLHVSVNYLMTGEESKYYQFDYVFNDPKVKTVIETDSENDKSIDRTFVYEKMLTLKDTDKKMIEDMIERLSDGYEEEC